MNKGFRALLSGKPWQHDWFKQPTSYVKIYLGQKSDILSKIIKISNICDENLVLLLYLILFSCYSCSHNIPSWWKMYFSNAAILLSVWIFWWTMKTGYSVVSDSNLHVYLQTLEGVTFLLFTPAMTSEE